MVWNQQRSLQEGREYALPLPTPGGVAFCAPNSVNVARWTFSGHLHSDKALTQDEVKVRATAAKASTSVTAVWFTASFARFA